LVLNLQLLGLKKLEYGFLRISFDTWPWRNMDGSCWDFVEIFKLKLIKVSTYFNKNLEP
jgi:hypothetical protein